MDLSSGKVYVRKVWVNKNSKKDQVAIQFIQELDAPAGGGSNPVIGMLQGIEGAGKTKVTCIESAAREQAEKLFGADKIADTAAGAEILGIEADALFGRKMAIQVTENTEKNPFSASQEPKKNPKTGEILVDENGRPIYRHTSLVLAEACENTFLRAAGTKAPSIGSALS